MVFISSVAGLHAHNTHTHTHTHTHTPGHLHLFRRGAAYARARTHTQTDTHTHQVIFISSVAGLRTFARCSLYGASKWAVQGIAGSLREEVKGFGVKIATLCPGSVASPWSVSLSLFLPVSLCLRVSVSVSESLSSVMLVFFNSF